MSILPRPALKRCNGEQCQHSLTDVVKIEVAIPPVAFDDEGSVDVAIFIDDKLTSVLSSSTST